LPGRDVVELRDARGFKGIGVQFAHSGEAIGVLIRHAGG
jgi:uncharacterized protein involved in propanediol utilization